jgi:hypothetical protein
MHRDAQAELDGQVVVLSSLQAPAKAASSGIPQMAFFIVTSDLRN